MAKRKKDSTAPATDSPTEATTAESANTETRNEVATQAEPASVPSEKPDPLQKAPLPDPRGIEMISLTDENAGPKMRLLRSFRHKDVWIQFDVNPGREFTEQIKAQGFRWESQAEAGDKKGAWVKPLEAGREIRIMLDAEKVFREVGNQIRKNNGLEPVGVSGPGFG